MILLSDNISWNRTFLGQGLLLVNHEYEMMKALKSTLGIAIFISMKKNRED